MHSDVPLCTALTTEWARDIPSKFTSGLSAGRPADAAPQRPAGARSSSSCRSSACYNSSCRSPGRRVPAGGACAACPPGTMGVLPAGGAAISLSRPAHPFTAKNPYYNSARFSMRTGGPAGRFASPTRPRRRQESACFCAFRRPAHPPGPGGGPRGGGELSVKALPALASRRADRPKARAGVRFGSAFRPEARGPRQGGEATPAPPIPPPASPNGRPAPHRRSPPRPQPRHPWLDGRSHRVSLGR